MALSFRVPVVWTSSKLRAYFRIVAISFINNSKALQASERLNYTTSTTVLIHINSITFSFNGFSTTTEHKTFYSIMFILFNHVYYILSCSILFCLNFDVNYLSLKIV